MKTLIGSNIYKTIFGIYCRWPDDAPGSSYILINRQALGDIFLGVRRQRKSRLNGVAMLREVAKVLAVDDDAASKVTDAFLDVVVPQPDVIGGTIYAAVRAAMKANAPEAMLEDVDVEMGGTRMLRALTAIPGIVKVVRRSIWSPEQIVGMFDNPYRFEQLVQVPDDREQRAPYSWELPGTHSWEDIMRNLHGSSGSVRGGGAAASPRHKSEEMQFKKRRVHDCAGGGTDGPCVICLDRMATVILIPCMHNTLCMPCTTSYVEEKGCRECPTCRGKIMDDYGYVDTDRVFRNGCEGDDQKPGGGGGGGED